MKVVLWALAFLSGALFLLGLLMVNLTWITFLFILGANILFSKHYPLFALTNWSLFGTPLEFFFGGIILMILGKVIFRFTEKLEHKYLLRS